MRSKSCYAAIASLSASRVLPSLLAEFEEWQAPGSFAPDTMFPEMHLGRCATREIRVYDCIHLLVITVLQSREPEQLSRCLAVCGQRESEEGTTEMFPIRRTARFSMPRINLFCSA